MKPEMLVALVALVGVLISAVSGLVGVIIGGWITSSSNNDLYEKRVQLERERENHKHTVEVRRAARLIDADLLRARTAAKICIEKRHWWSSDVPPLTVEGWQQHRGVVAEELSDDAWVALMVAIEAVDDIRTFRDLGLKSGSSTVSEPQAAAILPILHDLEAGRSALAPLAADPAKPPTK